MSLEPAPKKRKKKVDRCPNPLFVKWLTEWRDEAKDQGKKTQYAYGKVSDRLPKCLASNTCPIPGLYWDPLGGDLVLSEL